MTLANDKVAQALFAQVNELTKFGEERRNYGFMKKKLNSLVALIMVASAVTSSALQITDALGFVKDGEPADPTHEVNYVNSLVARANGVSPAPYDYVGKTYQLIVDPAITLPLAVEPVSTTDTDDSIPDPLPINVSGYTYLLAKYDGPNGGDYVWYVAGMGNVTIPKKAQFGNKNVGLSHYSLFNPTGVPDGGTTLALLGLGMLGLGAVARRIR
jgi:hypothetical protein